jgi:hypothetical protein
MTNGKSKSRNKTRNKSEIKDKCRFQAKDYEAKGYENKGRSKAEKCCRSRSKSKK